MSRFKKQQWAGGSKGGNFISLFEEQAPTNDLQPQVIKQARKTGVLTLCNKNLTQVPSKVWRINELDSSEVRCLSAGLESSTGDDRWWEQEDLTRLNLSSNLLTEVSADIKRLTALQILDLHDNKITSLPDEIGQLEGLIRVDLSRNLLTCLPESFCSLTKLRSLQVQQCRLQSLPSNLDNLNELEYLDVSNNKLTELSPSIGFMSFLRKLNASNNKIRELPREIDGLRSLELLDISQNQLQSLPDSIGGLRKLEQIFAHQNEIQKLPVPTAPTNLKEVHLSNNCIPELTSEFVETILRVKILQLGDNKITELPKNITLLQELERIELINNALEWLPPELSLLPHLKSITLEGNPIRSIRRDILNRGTVELLKYLRSRITDAEKIQAEIAKQSIVMPSDSHHDFLDMNEMRQFHNLVLSEKITTAVPEGTFEQAKEANVTTVDLSKNKLTFVPPKLEILSDLLTEVNLEYNKIKVLPSYFGICKRLTYLNLGRNQLSELPDELGELTRLREVSISCNNFTNIPSCLYRVKSLEILMVGDNSLVELDVEMLSQLPYLSTFDAHNNNIMTVPPQLGNMEQLKSLQLAGNPFRNPRTAILEKGTNTLLAYLRDRIPR